MKPTPNALTLAAILCATALSCAQKQFTDPANLRGERVSPRDGRELPIDQGASGLEQLLRKLNTRASVMNIVAHPDDEDGGMLTLYSRGFGARVADLSLTRGEGGQNAMTGDFEDALGLLRTQELLSSDRYTGVDQFFGTEVDFGFSKTKEESFAKWGHDRVLYDVVRAIRLYRPLVLTSTWIGGVTDGHGQHQVSGQIAQEAFLAAGDPKVFPDMIAEGILPWQPLRIYARVPQQAITDKGLFDYATGQYTPAKFTNYVSGDVTTTVPSADVLVHEGVIDPLLVASPGEPSKTYVQFARIGLAQQRSQIGPGTRPAPTGVYDVPYHLYGDRSKAPAARHITAQAEGLGKNTQGTPRAESPTQYPATTSDDPNFFTGIDTSLTGIADLAPSAPPSLRMNIDVFAQTVEIATENFSRRYPANTAGYLSMALHEAALLMRIISPLNFNATEKSNVLHELAVKEVQLNDALALALDLQFDATITAPDVVTGSAVNIATHLSHPEITLPTVREWLVNANQQLSSEETVADDEGILGAARELHHQLHLAEPFARLITRPYFRRHSIEQPIYEIEDEGLRLSPEAPFALTAWSNVHFGTEDVLIGRVVHLGPQPINIVPPLSISLSSHAQVLPQSMGSFSINMTVSPHAKYIIQEKLNAPDNWTVIPTMATANCPSCYTFHIDVPQTGRKPNTLDGSVKLDGHTYTEGYRPVGYGDLPSTNYYTPASTRIIPINLKIPVSTHGGLTSGDIRRQPPRPDIAYLSGTGDAVPEALASIGLTPTLLTVADLTPANLAHFDTVILGVRTYAAHPDLHGAPTQALLDYARNGGNVVVQYQTTEFTAADAPYPLSIGSNEKVVDETAPVQLLLTPQHLTALNCTDPACILSTPNKITPSDFNGWIEERGHGFLSTWDDHYSALTETHDSGQLPQRGGLITAPVGKGRWTYCAFVLYRQLPEAVPGAFRLFINLITP